MVSTKVLAVAGLAAFFLVGILGVWGWSDRDEARARHRAAVAAGNQKEFCEHLALPIGILNGRVLDPDVPVGLPPQPPSELDLAGSSGMLLFFFDEKMPSDSPPVVRDEVALMGRVAHEVQRTNSAEPFRRPAVRRAIATLETYWEDNCR